MAKFIRIKEVERGWLALNVDHILTIGEDLEHGLIELSTLSRLTVFQSAKEIMQLIEAD